MDLSRRTSRQRLIFTTRQVYIQCLGIQQIEFLSGYFKTELERSKSKKGEPRVLPEKATFCRYFPNVSIAKRLQDVVDRTNEYLLRSLTYDSDTLNTLLGV